MPKTRNDPMAIARCGAKTRAGPACGAFAMPNGRCRLHGGKSPGPPKGNRNAWKTGLHSRESVEERRRIRDLIREARVAARTCW